MNKSQIKSLTFKEWLTLSDTQQDDVVDYIRSLLENAYTHVRTRSYSDNNALRIPTFLHNASGMEFNLLFGNTFQMGLSEAEEKSVLEDQMEITSIQLHAETMRPVHDVYINPFLITRFPCTVLQAQQAISLNPNIRRYSIMEPEDLHMVIILTREEANAIAVKYEFSLPSEAQWEYACRRLTTTPFYFGEFLPEDEILEDEVLLQAFFDTELCLEAANAFGLVGLCVGEWCSDSYQKNYQHAPNNDQPIMGPPPYVVRGGAARLYPWQDCGEWKLCMSAYRQSSDTLQFKHNTWAARYVKRLNDLL